MGPLIWFGLIAQLGDKVAMAIAPALAAPSPTKP